jgi:hypothetical protein
MVDNKPGFSLFSTAAVFARLKKKKKKNHKVTVPIIIIRVLQNIFFIKNFLVVRAPGLFYCDQKRGRKCREEKMYFSLPFLQIKFSPFSSNKKYTKSRRKVR